jgi:hypothetical protein
MYVASARLARVAASPLRWTLVSVGRQLQALTNHVEDIVAEKNSKHNPNNRNFIRDYKKKVGK